jgi:DNA polymerase
MLIGEAPGAEEDRIGKPFVGRAGQLLNRMLKAIEFEREDVYIGNILKCRPPANRDPLPDEIAMCKPYLCKQIELIKPDFILALGRIAAQALLQTTQSLGRLRQQVHTFEGVKLLATYHPAALLRFPQYKEKTWQDLQLIKKLYDNE